MVGCCYVVRKEVTAGSCGSGGSLYDVHDAQWGKWVVALVGVRLKGVVDVSFCCLLMQLWFAAVVFRKRRYGIEDE